MALNCPDCGERVQNLMAHVCKSNKGKQDATDTNRSANQIRDNDPKRRDARLPVQRTDPAKPLSKVGASAKLSGSSGQEPIIAARSVERGKIFDGGVEFHRHAKARNKTGLIPEEAGYPTATRLVREEVSGATISPRVGVVTDPSKAKRGRPRIGETRDKPWIASGMSERTWYRRKKEKAK